MKREPAPSNVGAALPSHSRLRASPPEPSYGLMRELLRGYLSPVLVDSVLSKALASRRLSAQALSAIQLAELASDVMVGLRLFVPEERLPQLMLELAEMLERGA